MQEFLATLWEQNHKTVIFVTHDIEEAIFLADKVILLTQRPARIKKEFNVEFLRPRTHDLKFSDDFFNLKKIIFKTLESQ
jgi:ABC-type nitrate/sulfonate/bicarbonate transport system ATPase subunit